jgi:hypothetical protein
VEEVLTGTSVNKLVAFHGISKVTTPVCPNTIPERLSISKPQTIFFITAFYPLVNFCNASRTAYQVNFPRIEVDLPRLHIKPTEGAYP